MNFPSLPADAGVRHALALNREAGRLLANYHEVILRGKSSLSVAEREFIASYVSALNQCAYCHGTHAATARLFGVPAEWLAAPVGDDGLASVPERLQPLLVFARELTLRSHQVTPAHAKAVYDAGWSEGALHDLILVVSMFNFMNRFVHGHGIQGDHELYESRGRYLYEHGYSHLPELADAEAAEVDASGSGPP